MDPSIFGFGSLDETSSTLAASEADRRRVDRRQSTVRVFLGSVVVIAILYFMRPVIIPIALAILFAFLVSPIVNVLEKTFLRRTGAIVLSLGLALGLIGVGAWYLTLQANSLAKELVMYSGNIEKKLRVFSSSGGSFQLVERTIDRLAATAEPQERPDMKVRVIPERKGLQERYERLAPRVEALASAFLVIVLMFFLLQDREKLRDRVLRLAGKTHLTITTQAIGEMMHRISRYLLTLLAVNAIFGLSVGVGLALMKVPHALLWGIIAGLFRFIPYVGAVLSAALPTFLSLAYFEDWFTPIAVLGMFVLFDQLLGGFIEPLVVGHRVGVSPVALLITAIFWGWLWGPVGLLLATPITVCLTVAGEFIPAFRPFSIMFAADAPLEDYLSYYNRLLMRDRPSALAIADRYAEEHSMEAAFTDLFIPTLTFALDELSERRITTAQDHFIKDVTREAIIRLGDRNQTVGEAKQRIVAVSASHERLSLGTLMLTQLLRQEGYSIDYFTDLPEGEVIHFIAEERPEAVFVSCSNPKHLAEGYSLVRALRNAFDDVHILAGGSAFAQNSEHTIGAGASYVATSLTQAREDFLATMKKPRKRPAVRV